MEPFNSVILLRKLIVKYEIDDPKLQFELDIPKEAFTFVVEPEYEIKEILKRIIENAIKFTPIGKITLSVSLRQIDLNKVRFMFTVSKSHSRSH